MARTTKKPKLSIIIPYYNTKKYTDELLACLDPQITEGVEVLLIDDGSPEKYKTDYPWCKVIRQKNGGSSGARNTGIEKTTGEYISFIDSDDLVSEVFVKNVLEKIKDGADVIDLSWTTFKTGGYQETHKLNSSTDRLTNPSACTRVFKRAFIGDTRFNTKKDSTEDEDFSRKVGYLDPEGDFKHDAITDFMYFYRTYSETSKSKRYGKGLTRTKRVCYYYDQVTKDMTWLLDEIKNEDEINEVFLFTNRCELDGLKRYCQIRKPTQFWGHIIRGEKNAFLTLRKPPANVQVVIYRRIIPRIGGLATFIDNFIELMGDKYDITIACDVINEGRYLEWSKKVRVIAYKIKNVMRTPNVRELGEPHDTTREIYCDTLIPLSFLDALPEWIHPKKVVRMVHACKTSPDWEIPTDADETLYVSKTAMDSYGVKNGRVLHNIIVNPEERALVLVSATRLPAPDKGKVEERMIWLANELNSKGIKFIWLNFADGELPNPPRNFYNMGITSDMQNILKSADYLVQLSDSECWPYSCLEALTNNCACLVTEFPSAYEMGIEDGVNGYIIPFSLDFDVTKLRNVPKFNYDYDNEAIKAEWVEILGSKPPRHDYKPPEQIQARIKRNYYDMQLGKDVFRGEVYYMTELRANELRAKGLVFMEGENGEI